MAKVGEWDHRIERLSVILASHVGESLAHPVMQMSAARAGANLRRLGREDSNRFLHEIGIGLRAFLHEPSQRAACLREIEAVLRVDDDNTTEPGQKTVIQVRTESDVVLARSTGKEMCSRIGLSTVVQIKVATAISELARNIVQYAGQGIIFITVLANPRVGIEIISRDEGPGISNIDEILAGRYKSRSGMGMGLTGTRNLVDEFAIETVPGKGTTVRIRKYR